MEPESVYDREDRLCRELFGEDVCGERTSNGWPWAMPCTKQSGHDGECLFDGKQWEEKAEAREREEADASRTL